MTNAPTEQSALKLAPDVKGYSAVVLEVHDGDTIRVEVSLGRQTSLKAQYLGFSTYINPMSTITTKLHIRLFGINAPELATPEGVTAAAYLNELVVNKRLMVVPYVAAGHHVQDKYGRWLADLRTGPVGSAGFWVNKAMIDSGHAVPYFGGAR